MKDLRSELEHLRSEASNYAKIGRGARWSREAILVELINGYDWMVRELGRILEEMEK